MARKVMYAAKTSNSVYSGSRVGTSKPRSSSEVYSGESLYDANDNITMTPNTVKMQTSSVAMLSKAFRQYKASKVLSNSLAKNYTDIFDKRKNASIKTLNRSVGIYEDTPQNLFKRSSKYYNRFKLQNYDEVLQKGFAHVFFVRPNCNILTGSSSALKLNDSLRSNHFFNYILKNSPDVLKQLTINYAGVDHDFMFSLSNKACSFSLTDDFINSDTYGKTYSGYKIAYGKNNIESKTAGSFTINYNDDRHLHVYQIHKAWLEYINGCYRGEFEPRDSSILAKVLDYVSSVYYVITAEDGETIIFWTKYYGVFPTNIPLAQYAWAEGNIIKNPEIDIQYQYSFKEDFDPLNLTELNLNSRVSASQRYEPKWNPYLLTGAKTWVGAPYVELINDSNDWNGAWYYKLRFKSEEKA